MQHKKLAYIILIAILIAIIISIICIDYFFLFEPYRNLPHNISKEELQTVRPEIMSEETLKNLGTVITNKKSSFINFPMEKKKGNIRIGCFGCSFTYGDDTGYTSDYPYFLQQLLHSEGYSNYEVLNFGSSWYGFHQSAILFNDIGKRYNLDYVIIGPNTFYPVRDETFNHTGTIFPLYPGYIHARYRLKGSKDVELVPVIGSTKKEIIKEYYRFIPHRQYLLYDTYAPFALRALTKKKEILNPFFYARRNSTERLETIARLLKKIEENKVIRHVYVLTCFGDVVDYCRTRTFQKTTFKFVTFHQNLDFPYKAGFDHLSKFGNQLMATYVFQQIMGYTPGYFKEIRSFFTENTAPVYIYNPSLAHLPSTILFGDKPLGTFLKNYGWARIREIEKLKKNIIILKSKEPLKSIYLDNIPETPTRTKIKILLKENTKTYLLPPIQKIHPDIYIIPGIEFYTQTWIVGPTLLNFTTNSGEVITVNENVSWELFCNDRIVLSNSHGPIYGSYIKPKILEKDEHVQYYDIPDQGQITVHLGQGHCISFGKWNKQRLYF